MAACEFCEIGAGDRPATVLYEDETTIAFLDTDPAVEGHTLVVPRIHCEDLLTEDDAPTEAVFRTVRTVTTAIERAFDVDGFSIVHTSGVLVGHITHAYVHILPRFDDDDIRLALSRTPLRDDDAEELGERIRAAI